MPISSNSKTSPVVMPPSAKPAVALLPDMHSSAASWQVVAKSLREAGYQVYIPEPTIFLDSDENNRYGIVDVCAQRLMRYLSDVNLDRPVLIGHSTGATIVSAMLKHHPELVYNKAILISPIMKRPVTLRMLQSWLARFSTKKANGLLACYLLAGSKQLDLSSDQFAMLEISRDRISRKAAYELLRHSPAEFKSTAQVHFLVGEKDKLSDRAQILRLAQDWRASVEFLPDCGHLLNYERPQKVAQMIIKFLEK